MDKNLESATVKKIKVKYSETTTVMELNNVQEKITNTLKNCVEELSLLISKFNMENTRIIKNLCPNSSIKEMHLQNSTSESLTQEEKQLIKAGKYHRPKNKIRLIYFKGLRKGKFSNIKLLLFSLGIKPFQIINISFIGKQIFEIITKDIYVDHVIYSLQSIEIIILPTFNPCLFNSFEPTLKNNSKNLIDESVQKFRERITKGLSNNSRDKSKIPTYILEQLLNCDQNSINQYLLPTLNTFYNQNLIHENKIQ